MSVDYLEEAVQIYQFKQLNKSFLVEIVESFPEWLLYGSKYGSEIAVKFNEKTKWVSFYPIFSYGAYSY